MEKEFFVKGNMIKIKFASNKLPRSNYLHFRNKGEHDLNGALLSEIRVEQKETK